MENETKVPTLPSVGERQWYPLSFEQHRFYAVERFSENVRSASIPVGLDMEGALDLDVLEQSLPILVQRHESLRTVIREVSGNPVQVIVPNPSVTLARHDLVQLEEEARRAQIDKLIERDLKLPFALQDGPLYRFIVVKCAEDKHVLLLAFHHIIADFLSIGIFLDELSAIYCALLEGREPKLRELTGRYVDFSSWEKEFFSKEYLDTNLAFWRDALKGQSGPLALPYDSNPNAQAFGCLSEVLDFDDETQAAISAFCRANDLNKFVLYMAALSALIHGYTENERMVIGIPLGNRNFPETKPVIGTFANQSVAIVDLTGDPSFKELFSRLMLSLYNATTKVVPIIDIINILRKESGERQRPLKVVLTYLKDVYRTNIPGVFSRPIKTGRDTLDVDLFFTVIKHAAGEALSIEYAESLFEQPTIADMLAKFEAVLDLVMSDPNKRLSEVFASKIFQRRPVIQLASTFVSEPVEPALRFWMDRLKTRSKISFSPQGQVFQELVDPTSAFHRNADGYNVVLIRLEDWITTRLSAAAPAQEVADARAELERNLADFLAGLERAAAAFAARTIVAITPDSPAMLESSDWSAIAAAVEAELERAIARIRGVSFVRSEAITSLYELDSYYDATQDRLGHIPYTDPFYVALGTALARKIFAVQTSHRYKVVVVDCDNTLWKGVVGEDGVHGIVLSEAARKFQARLAQLQQSGMILCLCSKNAEADVLEVFAKRPDMVLSLDQIVAHKINWSLKSQNLRELAAELNLGLDSFVFIDDNPAECAEVAASCPGVLCLQFPSADEDVLKFVAHTWLFDREQETTEDDKRTQLYRENAERERYRTGFDSYRTFIENLALSIEIAPLGGDDLKRVSQLTYRTNQFNTTAIRRSEAELNELLARDHRCLTVRVRDRFGDYGLVGVMIHARRANELLVDTFLLSCRALGKGVEHAMLATLGRLAAAAGCAHVRLPLRPTAKNAPVRSCLDELAGEHRLTVEDGLHYVVPTAVAAAIDFFDALERREGGGDVVVAGDGRPEARSMAGGSHAEFIDSTWRKYASLNDIAKEIGPAKPKPKQASGSKPRLAAQTPTEVKLAEIFADVLGLDELGAGDDIFDLGGTSFDVVKIISRINESFAISFDHHAFLRSPVLRDVAYQVDYYLQHGAFDEQLGAIDLEAEATLAPDIAANGRPFLFEVQPKHVFVTGVTGFLGAHLLRELLEQTSATVYCHVRASSKDHGSSRVFENLQRYQIWKPEYRGRIEVVLGDLAKPRLGIEDSEYLWLSREVDIIYHNGSIVDFIKPYRALKDGNVRGTEEILRLAALHRIQPVVYVSTVALFNSAGAEAGVSRSEIAEEFVQSCDSPPLGGYAQSKWVAERLVTIAASRGLPVCIFRPGEIAGSSETGHLNESDILSILFYAMIGMKCLPDLETTVDFIPVDLLSRMMVRIASSGESIGRVYNMVHPEPVDLLDYAREVNALMPVELVPYREWTTKLASYAEATNDDHIRSLMHLFTEEVPGKGKTWIESTANRGAVSVKNTLRHLTAEELEGYRIDRALIGKYLSRIEASPRHVVLN